MLICIYATDPKKLVTCPAQHRAYEFFLFALPPTREWVRLIRGEGGLQAANGSGKRGLGTGGEPSGAQRTCARSYLQLDITKPKAGRHGARGAGWQNKCPFWMSSTQWGKVETVGDEGAVSGYTCGAWGHRVRSTVGLWRAV